MPVHKAYKFRLYPNKEQETLIAKTMGCSRFVFNHFLVKWRGKYKKKGKGLTYHSCSNQLPSLKREYEWLKEVDSIAIQSASAALPIPSPVFSKSKIKPPQFKSKNNPVQSYT